MFVLDANASNDNHVSIKEEDDKEDKKESSAGTGVFKKFSSLRPSKLDLGISKTFRRTSESQLGRDNDPNASVSTNSRFVLFAKLMFVFQPLSPRDLKKQGKSPREGKSPRDMSSDKMDKVKISPRSSPAGSPREKALSSPKKTVSVPQIKVRDEEQEKEDSKAMDMHSEPLLGDKKDNSQVVRLSPASRKPNNPTRRARSPSPAVNRKEYEGSPSRSPRPSRGVDEKEKSAKQRKFVFEELISTEESYVEQLEIIVKFYREPLQRYLT